jgi:hypothetical protein
MVAGMAEAGQCRDEPLHEEDRRTFHQDTMAEPDLRGITHCRWDDCFRWTGRHPEVAGRFLEHVAVCWDHLARVATWRSPRGANVLLLGC